MSETQSGSKRQGTSRQGTSQVTRSRHGRTAKIRRTREVIERVEVEHEAVGGEPPVTTTAEQRVFNATEMERGKPGEITSRKQPGRGGKKTSEREIPIQAATAPDAAAAAEPEQGVPPLMSTQDYLEEAEELLTHPLNPTDLQTQTEVPPTEEEEDGLVGGLAGQAPEDAAAAGERLAAHMEADAGAEPDNSTQPSADAGAPASEGGLVGRVAQVGRRIVRSLLHPDGQGAGADATAADGGAAAADAGEAGHKGQDVPMIAENGTAHAAGSEIIAVEPAPSVGNAGKAGHEAEAALITLAEHSAAVVEVAAPILEELLDAQEAEAVQAMPAAASADEAAQAGPPVELTAEGAGRLDKAAQNTGQDARHTDVETLAARVAGHPAEASEEDHQQACTGTEVIEAVVEVTTEALANERSAGVMADGVEDEAARRNGAGAMVVVAGAEIDAEATAVEGVVAALSAARADSSDLGPDRHEWCEEAELANSAQQAEGEGIARAEGDAGEDGAEAHGYHVEEPDQDQGSPETPEDTPPQTRAGSRQAEPPKEAQAPGSKAEPRGAESGGSGAKRSPASAQKLKPYTPAKMAAMRGTPQEVQPVEDVLTQPAEAQPVEDAAPAPKTPPPKRGRPAALKAPSTSKGKVAARPASHKEPAAAQGAGEAGGAPNSSPKRGRGRPSKAAAKTEAPAKRTRLESPAGEAETPRKAQKTEPAPAGRPKSPQAGQGRAAGKGASKRTKGPQKRAVRKPASRRKERPDSFKIYIHRVLKEVHPDLSLSNKAIGVLDGFTKDLRERITLEASQLCRVHNKATLSSREIDAAIRLLLPGELFSHAVSEGRKAVTRALT